MSPAFSGRASYRNPDACRAFPDPRRDELGRGFERSFQILDPLEFLAEFTQHIPPKGAHLVRYYGWYSNKAREMRRKQTDTAAAESPAEAPAATASDEPALGAGLPTPPTDGAQVSSKPPARRRVS